MAYGNILQSVLEMASAAYLHGEGMLGRLEMQVVAMVISICVFWMFAGTFYETLSRKEVFDIGKPHKGKYGGKEYSLTQIALFLAKYTIVFPLISIIWLLALAIFLIAVSDQAPERVLIITVSIAVSTRILSYYDEKIAVDVAKLLPVILLGLAITSPTYFSQETILAKGVKIMSILPSFSSIFAAFVILEWGLRLLLQIKRTLFGFPDPDEIEDIDELEEFIGKKKKAK